MAQEALERSDAVDEALCYTVPAVLGMPHVLMGITSSPRRIPGS